MPDFSLRFVHDSLRNVMTMSKATLCKFFPLNNSFNIILTVHCQTKVFSSAKSYFTLVHLEYSIL